MRTRLFGAVLVAFFVFGTSADARPFVDPAMGSEAQADTLTLEEAVALALRDNRDLRSLRMYRALDRFDLFLAHRSYWPTGGVAVSALRRKADNGASSEDSSVSPSVSWHSPIGTSASVNWSRFERLDGTGGGTDSFSATIRQPLLRGAGWDVNMVPLRQAKINAELAYMNEEEAVAGLIDQVTFSYRNLIQAQERLTLSQMALERSRQLLDTNQALIDAGRMAAADIVQTQSEVANQEVALLETERSLTTARTQLLNLLALDPSMPLRAQDQVEAEAVELDADQAVAFALSNRRDLKARRLNFEQLEMSEKLARNSRLWDVSVVAGYDRFNPVGGGPDLSSHSVGLQLSIPIADFSGRRNVMGAQTALHTAELAYDSQLDRIEGQVREAVADVQSRWRQLEAANRAKTLALRSVEIQQARLRAGRASNFEVLSLQNNLRSADAQALTARIAYLNALTTLDQQLGRTLETWQISLEP